jgi:uncharacterized C2H2 Zn-finger protein
VAAQTRFQISTLHVSLLASQAKNPISLASLYHSTQDTQPFLKFLICSLCEVLYSYRVEYLASLNCQHSDNYWWTKCYRSKIQSWKSPGQWNPMCSYLIPSFRTCQFWIKKCPLALACQPIFTYNLVFYRKSQKSHSWQQASNKSLVLVGSNSSLRIISSRTSVYLTGQNTRMSPKWYSNEAKLLIILKI